MLKYRLRRIPRKKIIFWSTFVLIFMISIGSIVRFYAIADLGQNSVSDNITADTVYVNDLQADWDYYESLNFTELTTRDLPTGYSNKYNQDTLVAVRLVYDGRDINNPSLVGKVSGIAGESQHKFVYYKYYPIDSDGYITIELIDNPYTARPKSGSTYKGFNGWVCDDEVESSVSCADMEFTYDYDYYLRYLKVKAPEADDFGDKKLSLYLRATWVDGFVASNFTYETFKSTLKPVQMINIGTEDVTASEDIYDWFFVKWIFDENRVYYEKSVVQENERYYGYKDDGVTSCGTDGCVCMREVVEDETTGSSGSSGSTYIPISCNYYKVTSDTEIAENKSYWFVNDENVLEEISLEDGSGLAEFKEWRDTGRDEVTVTGKSLKGYENGDSLAGLYYKVTDWNDTANKHLYYTNTGKSCALVSCSVGSTVYRLIQTDDDYLGTDGKTISKLHKDTQYIFQEYIYEVQGEKKGTKITNDVVGKYYYLVTRDINFLIPTTYTSGTNSTIDDHLHANKTIPLTVTSDPAGSTSSTKRTFVLDGKDPLVFKADTVIENVVMKFNVPSGVAASTVYGESSYYDYGGVAYSNYYNVKYGRNITTNSGCTLVDNLYRYNLVSIIGGGELTTSTTTFGKSKTIIESGFMNTAAALGNTENYTSGHAHNVSNKDINVIMQYGSDYDRVKGDNSKLGIRISAAAYRSSHFVSTSLVPVSEAVVKSGTFGILGRAQDNVGFYYTNGLYAGPVGCSGHHSNALTKLKVEGGDILNINGGPYIANGAKVTTMTHMTGGTAYSAVGGAGAFYSYGDRILSVSGGTIYFSVAGGSASNTGDISNSNYGPLNGSTLVYVGGEAVIGADGNAYNKQTTLQGTTKGNVFGAGYGNKNNDKLGSVYNSHVIINGGTITGSVYGGGNYGVSGNKNVSTSVRTTIVDIYKGDIKNSVYGGSNEMGEAYTKTTINLYGGNISGSVYGGGKGSPTIVRGNTVINAIPAEDRDLIISGHIYGGSELGRVNVSGSTTININGGILNNVYGGGKGSNTVAPVSSGHITVNIKNGQLKNVFGGSQTNGSVPASTSKNLKVNVSGGTMNNVFGGSDGAKTNAVTTNVTVTGGVIDSVYGGSNAATNVTTTSNVTINGGNIGYVYGGGYSSGTTTTNLTINSGIIKAAYAGGYGSSAAVTTSNGVVTGGEFSEALYGGGKQAKTTTANLDVSGGKFYDVNELVYVNIYGGGEQAAVTTTNVDILAGADVYNIFGGSNISGTVTTTNVNANGGNVACNLYGGGNFAEAKTTKTNLNGSVFTYQLGENETAYTNDCGNAFGGGANAIVSTKSIVNLNGGSLVNVYGGSNKSGDVKESNVIVKSGTVQNVFGGNNIGGSVTDSKVEVNGDSNLLVTNIFGGSNGIGASITGTTTTDINSGTVIGDVFGGGNQAKVVKATYVNMRGGTIHSLYGGGNRSFVGDAEVNNAGVFVNGITTGATYVNVINGTVNGNVYGSSNASFVYGTTSVKVGDYALTSLNITDTTQRNITIKGSVFAGSETNADSSTTYDDNYEGVTGPSGSGTGLVEIGGSKYIVNDASVLKINGSVYGSGNNSKVVNGSTVHITSLGTKKNPVVFTSLQRATTVYVTDSHMELNGSVDRADPDSYTYSLIRLDNLYLLGSSATNGTYMYLRQGASYLKALNSGVMESGTFTPQKVTDNNGTLSVSVSDNRVYMLTNKVLSVSDSDAPIYDNTSTKAGPITGMAFLGMYTHESGKDFVRGIYDYGYTNGSVYSEAKTGSIVDTAYTFVYGLNLPNYTMKQQVVQHGFYTNVVEGEEDEVLGGGSESDGGSDDGKTLKYQYVGVTPANETTLYYKWVIGVEPVEIIVDLVADKYSESGAVNALISLDELKETIINADGSSTKQEWRDAIMTIESVDTTSFGATAADATKAFDGILVDKSEIPTINTEDKNNDGVVDANNYFALSMGTTSTGWLNDYKTNFYDKDYELTGDNFCSTATGNCTGNQIYLYDSTTKPRNLSFWLYHSKNLDFSYVDKTQDLTNMLIKMNTVYIDVEFRNPHGDPTSTDSIQPVRITVNIALSDGELDKYGGVIAPGKKYEMFQGRPTVIASNGSFSIYQQLSLDLTKTIAGSATNEKWGVEKLYHPEKIVTIKDAYNQIRDVEWSESYRYLASSYLLPVGTVITMLDLKNNEQYYYEVTTQNYSEKEREYAGKNEYKYFLEDFIRMGCVTKDNLFDDDMNEENSTKYYYKDDNSKLAVEEFIFNVDFAGANVQIQNENGDEHYFYLQLARLEDGAEKIVMSTKGSPMTEMVYTLKPQVSSEISTTGGYIQEDGSISDDTIIYVGESAELELETSLIQLDENGDLLVGVSDTKFDEYKLGAKITIKRAQLDEDGNIKYDSNNNIIYEVVTSDLFGTVMEINGRNYYPQTDGSTRLELAGRITDVVSDINIDFSNSGLTYGKYVLVVETFVSYDGLYYGDFEPTYGEFPFELLNNQYGLDVKTETPKQITHDVNTGMDSTGNRQIHYLVDVVNGLADPNLKVSVERRDYGTTYGTGYHSIPVDNIIEEIKFGNFEDNLVTTNGTCFSMSTDNSCYIYSIGNISGGSVLKTYDVYLTLKDGPAASDLGTNKPNAKWKSGTYKVIFTLYDGDVEVGSVYEYLIIRSLSVDEIVIEGSGN